MFPRRVAACALVPPATATRCGLCTSSRFFASRTCALCMIHHHPPGTGGGHNLPWYRPAAKMPKSTADATHTAAAQPPSPSVYDPVQLSDILSPANAAREDASPPAVVKTESAQGVQQGFTVPAAVRANAAAAAAAVVAANSSIPSGPLRATPTRRMSALSGPSLDTRIEDIVKVEENLAAEMLPKVVQLLIDPNAADVERISLADFVAMQPKRQLVALGGRKQWLEFLQASSYYQQVARLAAESPAHDLRALQQAGIYTLHQWAEQPNLVRVSARTRSALNASLEYSITTYMKEVAQVVNTSTQLEPLLNKWVSDILGKFILDSLKISVESASAALWKRRGGSMPGSDAGAKSHDAAQAADMMMMMDEEKPQSTAATAGGRPVLRPGEACTLEHFHHFVLKVVASVRQDYASQHAAMGSPQTRGDAQSEAEILERTHTVIATALTQLLEQVTQQHLPAELRPLRDNGYLALDRVPALLRRAVSYLHLRNLPVRCFVFHSTLDASSNVVTNGSSSTSAVPEGSSLDVVASAYAPGTFLTGSDAMNVTLGEWSGSPEPPSSTGMEDPAQLEYASVLHRLRRHVDTLSVTSILEVLRDAESYGAHGFNTSEAIGLHQLFGPTKLVEDRLVSLLNYPPATADKPLHFIEAGHTAGKTAVLERLQSRTRAGERAVLVRYGGSAMPFVPDLDDHPVAFASRFWFRVALASCPHLIRTEELFSRAPRSVMWWGNEKNWSWEAVQSMLSSANHVGFSRRSTAAAAQQGGANSIPQLSTVLVDDIDRVLDSMAAKWGIAASAAEIMSSSPEDALPAEDPAAAELDVEENDEEEEDPASSSKALAQQQLKQRLDAATAMTTNEQRQQVVALYLRTGKPVPELLAASFSKITTALGQLDMVFTGQRLSPLLQTHSAVPCRRYFIPVANGVGLQQRFRVLPLMSVLHALHLRSRLEMPGLLYEVLKNCPALAGKVLEMFWSGRIDLMDLRTGPSGRALAEHNWLAPGGEQSSSLVAQSYLPHELFAELPLRNNLLQHPRRARLRLVELLQRQLSSPTGYLSTGIDTTASDIRVGLVTPHNHTASQVHPFALFVIFSHQDALEMSRMGDRHASGLTTGGSGGTSGYGKEKRVVRAWAEVWSEYRTVVQDLATTPARKRDAMRVLLHGALLLRSAAVAGAQLDLNLKVPAYGFPLLASEVRVKGKHANASADGVEVRAATADTVRKATSAYKSFFSTATHSHFPFRPMVGLNGGCDVVFISGATMALYDIVTTSMELRDVVYRFAEALLGVIHVLERQVLPVDKIRHVQYVTVVSIDQVRSDAKHSSKHNVDMYNPNAAHLSSSAPYFIDFHAAFEDHVRDRLRQVQEPLGLSREYRTLADLLDELETRFHVRAHHEVMASHAELESLLSPTLLQLVPDATVLPPYTSAVITAEDLMIEAMRGSGSKDSNRAITHTRSAMNEEDDDDAADALADGIMRGAEVEDVNSEQIILSADVIPAIQHDPLLADQEHVLESAELLEAILNDQLEGLVDTSRQEAAMAKTAQELREDDALENRINYRTHAPLTPTAAAAASAAAAAGDATNNNSKAGDRQDMDSLAWLHDIITPESLLAGLHGSNGNPSNHNAADGSITQQNTAVSSGSQGLPAVPSAARAASEEEEDEEDDLDEDEDDEKLGKVLAASGVDSTESVFPVTAAKRTSRGGRRGASATPTGKVSGRRANKSSGNVVDLEKLLHAVGSRTSKNRKAAAAAAAGGKSSSKGKASKAKAKPKAGASRSSSANRSSSASKKSASRTTAKKSKSAASKKKGKR